MNSETSGRKQSHLPVVFDERKALVGKWFDKWSTSQRVTIIEDLVQQCSRQQLQHVSDVIHRQKLMPVRDDFTFVLPRCLSLHVFSFLDPRSLCRCSQVSWKWRSLVDSDDLWIILCQRLGWTLNCSISSFDKSAWKRLYIDNIVSLKRTVAPLGIEKLALSDRPPSSANQKRAKSGTVSASDQRPPWKGSDRTPRDIWRHNYLENEDDDEKTMRMKRSSMDEYQIQRQKHLRPSHHHHRPPPQHQRDAVVNTTYSRTAFY